MAEPAASGSHDDHPSWLDRFGKLASGSAPKADEPAAPAATKAPVAKWFDAAMAAKDPVARQAAINQGRDAYAKTDPPADFSTQGPLPYSLASDYGVSLNLPAPYRPDTSTPDGMAAYDADRDLVNELTQHLVVEQSIPVEAVNQILSEYVDYISIAGRAQTGMREGDGSMWVEKLTGYGISQETAETMVVYYGALIFYADPAVIRAALPPKGKGK